MGAWANNGGCGGDREDAGGCGGVRDDAGGCGGADNDAEACVVSEASPPKLVVPVFLRRSFLIMAELFCK